jgi:hypothetical protein
VEVDLQAVKNKLHASGQTASGGPQLRCDNIVKGVGHCTYVRMQ